MQQRPGKCFPGRRCWSVEVSADVIRAPTRIGMYWMSSSEVEHRCGSVPRRTLRPAPTCRSSRAAVQPEISLAVVRTVGRIITLQLVVVGPTPPSRYGRSAPGPGAARQCRSGSHSGSEANIEGSLVSSQTSVQKRCYTPSTGGPYACPLRRPLEAGERGSATAAHQPRSHRRTRRPAPTSNANDAAPAHLGTDLAQPAGLPSPSGRGLSSQGLSVALLVREMQARAVELDGLCILSG